MIAIKKKIVVDERGNPQEVIISWAQFQELIEALGLLQGQVIDFKAALMTGDQAAIDALLARGKRSRDALGTHSVPDRRE